MEAIACLCTIALYEKQHDVPEWLPKMGAKHEIFSHQGIADRSQSHSLDNVADEYMAKRARGVQFFKAMELIRPGALTLMPEYVLPDYFSWTTKFYFKSDGERDKLS